jgi:hypothetical protein
MVLDTSLSIRIRCAAAMILVRRVAARYLLLFQHSLGALQTVPHTVHETVHLALDQLPLPVPVVNPHIVA